MILDMDAQLLEVFVFIFQDYYGFFTTCHLNDFQRAGFPIQNPTFRLSLKNCAQLFARKLKKKMNIIARLWKWERLINRIIVQNLVPYVVAKRFRGRASIRNVCEDAKARVLLVGIQSSKEATQSKLMECVFIQIAQTTINTIRIFAIILNVHFVVAHQMICHLLKSLVWFVAIV